MESLARRADILGKDMTTAAQQVFEQHFPGGTLDAVDALDAEVLRFSGTDASGDRVLMDLLVAELDPGYRELPAIMEVAAAGRVSTPAAVFRKRFPGGRFAGFTQRASPTIVELSGTDARGKTVTSDISLTDLLRFHHTRMAA